MATPIRYAQPFVNLRSMVGSNAVRFYTNPRFMLDYNAAVLSYARAALGRQVGDGECWALVNAALEAAGARQPGTGGLGTYEFGRLVSGPPGASLSAYAWPGDIIQFEGVELVYPGGAGRYSFPKHTAIVALVQGSSVTLIEQNSNGRRFVTQATYDLQWVTAGAFRVYRPQAR